MFFNILKIKNMYENNIIKLENLAAKTISLKLLNKLVLCINSSRPENLIKLNNFNILNQIEIKSIWVCPG